ncbi:MAG: hypothetical protein AB1345_12835 [Chloroflexota bacterium]
MKKVLSSIAGCIARLLAFLFATLFVVTALIVLFVSAVERKLLDPDIYKSVLARERIYDYLPELVADQIIVGMTYEGPGTERQQDLLEALQQDGGAILEESPAFQDCIRQAAGEETLEVIRSGERGLTEFEKELITPCLEMDIPFGEEEEKEGGPPDFMKILTPEDWRRIVAALLPSEWLQSVTESVIDQLFANLESEEAEGVIRISLKEFKERLMGEGGYAVVVQLMSAQPPCTQEEISAISQAIEEGGVGEIPMCSPPAEQLEKLEPMVHDFFGQLAEKLPDERLVPLKLGGEEGEPPSPPEEGGKGFSFKLQTFRRLVNLAFLIPLFLLLLVALFGIRSVKGLLRWWGLPFLFVGLIGLGIAFLALPVLDVAVNLFLMDRIPPHISPELVQTGLNVVRGVVQDFMRVIKIETGIIGFVGLVMVVCSSFIHLKTEPKV